AVPILSCGLAVPSLLIANGSISIKRRYFYLAALTVGFISLIYQPANGPQKIFWGVSTAIVVWTAGAIAIWIYRGRDNVRSRPSLAPLYFEVVAILLGAGVLLLFIITIAPLLSLRFTETSWLGLGLGWGSQNILQRSDLIPAFGKQPHAVPALVLTISSLSL